MSLRDNKVKKNHGSAVNCLPKKVNKKRISNIHCKQDLLMKSLSEFFSNEKKLENILDIINGKSKISLRVIDWFVTNYCKKNNIAYDIYPVNKTRKDKFIVHLNYKTQLKSFSKKQFDPFRRDSRITFEYGKNKKIVTTVGQLNFFRWAIKNNILKYITKHLDEIEKDMNNSTKFNKSKNQPQTNTTVKIKRKNRRELSKSATKSINKRINVVEIDFS